MSHVAHTSFYAMGTRCNIVLPAIDEDEADVIFRHIRHEIARIEGKLSRFVHDSAISIVNAGAATSPVNVDDEIWQVLSECKDYFAKTWGSFDITLRPILQHWGENPPGDASVLAELLTRLGTEKITLDTATQSVSFENGSIEIDLGGFGKGYALEKIDQMLQRFGITSIFVSLGESSVLTRGHHPAGDHWKVGIKSFLNAEETMHTFDMKNASLSTSANFYIDDAGNRINHRHVIDPKTGIPVEAPMTVSVFADSAVQAEVLSTAFLVMPEALIPEILHEFPDITILKVNYTAEEPVKTLWTSGAAQVHTV
jgi:FAD:protein FMN transferase